MNPAIDGLVDTPLFVRTVSVTERPNVDYVWILRLNHDAAYLASIVQADMRPGRAAIGGFVDAVARGQIGTNVGLTGTGINDLAVGWSDRDRADGADRLTVKYRVPNRSGVGGFPNAAVHRTKIKSGRVTRHARHGDHAAASEWSNQAPFEAIERFRRNRLGDRCLGHH